MKFSFLPVEVKFFDHFQAATSNLLDGARLLQKLLDDYHDVDETVAQITEIEHRGDFQSAQAAVAYSTSAMVR